MQRQAKDRDAGTRRRLIEATAQIMRDEGYAAATSRHVAAKVGVKSALVYYYFATIDDLYLAVLRSGADAALARVRDALTDTDPLRALWLINSDSRLSGLNLEFMALANHRKVIGAELKAFSERVLRRTHAAPIRLGPDYLSLLPASTVTHSSDARNSTALLMSTGSTQPTGTCINSATTAGVDVGRVHRVHPNRMLPPA